MDDHVGDAGADVDQDLGTIGQRRRGREGTQQGERVEVDADRGQPGSADRRQVAGDHVLLGGHQEDPQHPLPALGLELGQHVEVELDALDRDGQVILGLEGERAAELVRWHPGKVHLADHHPLVADTEDDPLGAELCPPPQRPDRRRDRDRVHHLAIDDRPGRQADLADADEHDVAAADRQLGRPHRGGADVETDDIARHLVSPVAGLFRLPWGRARRPWNASTRPGATLSRV